MEFVLFIIAAVVIFVFDRIGGWGKIRRELSVLIPDQLPATYSILILFFAWAILPALGWHLGWFASDVAWDYQIQTIDPEITNLLITSLGFFLGIILTAFISGSIFLTQSSVEPSHATILVISCIGGFILGIVFVAVISPFFILMAGMGCDVPSAEQSSICIRSIYFFWYMIIFFVLGATIAFALSIILKQIGFNNKSVAVRSLNTIPLLIIVAWILTSCIVLIYIPGEDLQVILTDSLARWITAGLVTQGILLGFMIMTTFVRIQTREWETIDVSNSVSQ